ncbi:putative cystathionine gamma-synthase protein [Favolaschia claudopus]|uniref:Cystathionine gamma-synthase protein n=1 Tax=Favolaschia claudopus TaxID=2862362 RepID=A0AAW0CHN7_9AGAR
MVANRITTELGHSIPPEGPHTITFQVPGWDNALAFRDGDQSLFQKLESLYPRFMPFGLVKQLCAIIQEKASFPAAYGCLPFLHPASFSMAQAFAFSHHRKIAKLEPGELIFKIVDIHGVRLYCVGFPADKRPGIMGCWQNSGAGISSRMAEHLLNHTDTIIEVPFNTDAEAGQLPPPTYLPQTNAHEQLRERIFNLLIRAPVTPQAAGLRSGDIYLYPTGMAAIYRVHEAIMQVRPGPLVGLGAIFHNTYHMFRESPEGFKHFGPCDAQSKVMDGLEAYVKTQQTVSYVFVEFPSNPVLVSVDLKRLRQLADQYGFIIVVDDTIGSFCNIDVLSAADVIITSLTKSFSGYADVMGGSVVLNPSFPFYTPLKNVYQEAFHNEIFAGDVEHLLANSADYLARSATLNRNAKAVADLLQRHVGPGSAVTQVLYPPHSDTAANYTTFMRPATETFNAGYGCLLSVEFASRDAARAFYDHLQVHQGPHLGAHLTLAMNYNEWVLGKDPEDFEYHIGYGLKREQVRISVGLEEVEELVQVFEEALRFAEKEV